MKRVRLCLTVVLLITTSALFGQKRFQPGYYFDNSGNRVEGLIKNETWSDNPSGLDFKTTEDSGVTKLTMSQVKEFGIGEVLRFIRVNVDLDRSPSNIQFISGKREPQFTKETIFLKVLLSGKASLYSYKEGDLQRYFYAVNNGDITQLIYKIYSSEGKLAYNNTFKSQLLQDLSCGETDLKDVRVLEYKKVALTSYFKAFAQCSGYEYNNYTAKEKKSTLVKIRVMGGLNSSSMVINHERFGINNDSGGEVSFTLGAELEFFLPSQREEWSVFFQPHFSSFSTTGDLQEVVEIEYNTFNASFGVRKHFPVSENARLFITGYFNVNFSSVINIPLSLYRDGLPYTDIDTNWGLGAGLEINNKLSGEVKYGLSRDVLSNLEEWTADFQTTTLMFRYRIFNW